MDSLSRSSRGRTTADDIVRALEARGPVKRTSRGWRALCPVHDDRRPSLDVDLARDGVSPLVRCRACGAGLLAVLDALGLRGAGSGAVPALSPRPRVDRVPSAGDAQRTAYALELWRRALPARGTLVERYLASRALTLPDTDRLRYAPALEHRPSRCSWPCMLALVTRGHDDVPLALHRTYLALDGSGKAPVEPQRMMLGPCSGGAVRLAPHDPTRELAIGEGIETVRAVAQATGLPAWAALSTSGLVALELPHEVRDVLVAADGDHAGERAAYDVAQRWTREGRRVRIAIAPRGRDFADILAGGAGGAS